MQSFGMFNNQNDNNERGVDVNMNNVIKVATIPGRPVEVVVQENTTVRESIELAGLNIDGRDVRVDGNEVDLDSKVIGATIVTLGKKIKGNNVGGGNMNNVIKVATIPGRPVEVVIEEGTTVAQAIELAGLDATGRDIRVDGNETTLEVSAYGATIITLGKKIKGNGLVKVATIPGRPVEVVVENDATVQDAIDLAELDATGRDIRVDGNEASLEQQVGNATIITLGKKIKGNK